MTRTDLIALRLSKRLALKFSKMTVFLHRQTLHDFALLFRPPCKHLEVVEFSLKPTNFLMILPPGSTPNSPSPRTFFVHVGEQRWSFEKLFVSKSRAC